MKIYLTGFLQVFFVAANTFFIANLYWIGIAICSFLISFIWCYNVGKISKGTLKLKLLYSLGAMSGGVLGVLISNQII